MLWTLNIRLFYFVVFIQLLLSCKQVDRLNFNQTGTIISTVVTPLGTETEGIMLPIKTGNFEYNESQCNFGLIDINRNNIYNEIGIDALEILPTNENQFVTKFDFQTLKENNIFKFDDQFIEISSVSEDGNSAEWEVMDTMIQRMAPSKTMMGKIPTFTIEDIYGEQLSISSLLNKGKLIYVEFWGTWCRACVSKMPETVRMHKKFKNKIKVISLAYNDSLDDVRSFTSKKNMTWRVAIANKSIKNKFAQVGFPRAYLFDQHGRLIDFNVSPMEISKYVND